MINLLPPKEKDSLIREERCRLCLILIITVLFFLICLSLILLSLEVYITSKVESQRILVQTEIERFQSPQTQQLEQELKLVNKQLSNLNSFYQEYPDWTGLLEKVSGALPESAYFKTFSFFPVLKEENKFQVSLTGVSPTREDLFEFKKALEAELNFKEVYFPPSSWVTPTDFSVTFKVEI